MAGKFITINEALNWMKTLKERHSELQGLRGENSHRELRYLGQNADKVIEKKPLYDVRELDKTISQVAREIRILDSAVKATNANVMVQNYTMDETVLGELVSAKE